MARLETHGTAGRSTMNSHVLFAGCVAIWGTTWLAITYQLGSVAPELSVGYRFLFAALLIAVHCRVRGLALRFRAAEHAALALLGLAMYSVSYIFVYHAEMHVVSGLVAIAYSTSPLIALIGMRLFFRQAMSARMALGAALGIAGILLVYWPEFGRAAQGTNVALGASLAALAVLASTAGTLLAHRNLGRGLRGWPSMAWSMGYGGLIALGAALALGRPFAFDLSPGYLLSLLYLSVVGTVLTFAAFLTLIERIGVTRASYIGVMVPIVALVISSLFEDFTWHALTLAGVAVSLAGNLLVLRR